MISSLLSNCLDTKRQTLPDGAITPLWVELMRIPLQFIITHAQVYVSFVFPLQSQSGGAGVHPVQFKLCNLLKFHLLV